MVEANLSVIMAVAGRKAVCCAHLILLAADGIEQPIDDREPGANGDELAPNVVEHCPLL